MLCTLLYVNKCLTSQYAGRGVGLTARYQLSENIRVLRLVIPVSLTFLKTNYCIQVVVMDGLITVENILGQLLLGVNKRFQPELCDSQPSYFALFLLVNIVRIALSS